MKDLYTLLLINEAKEKGLNNALSSSSGEDEILVAFAINKAKGIGPKNDKKHLETLTDDPKKVQHLLELYKANKEKIEKTGEAIAKQLGEVKEPFRKLKDSEVKRKEGNQGKGTPKTDLVSGEGENSIPLSLKKANSPSAFTQFFSGKPGDIRSAFENCKTLITDEEDYNDLMSTLDDWPSYEASDSDKVKSENRQKNKDKTKVINEILSKYPEFRRALFREAITGASKFEDNSAAIAKHVLVWDFDNPDNCHVQNALDFADMTAAEYVTGGTKVGVRMKGDKGKGKAALRMEDNNRKHDYSYHDPENGLLPSGDKEASKKFTGIKNEDGTYKSVSKYMEENIGVCAGKQIVPKEECVQTEETTDDSGVTYVKRPKKRGEGLTVYRKGDPDKKSCMSVQEFNKLKAKNKK